MNPSLFPQYEILVKHTPFFELWFKDQYIPKDKEIIVGEIFRAYQQIEPNARDPFGCSGCVIDMLRYANIHRVSYMNKYPKKKK